MFAVDIHVENEQNFINELITTFTQKRNESLLKNIINGITVILFRVLLNFVLKL